MQLTKEQYGENQYGFWLYRLTSPSGKRYYGLTKDYETRFAQHKRSAESGAKSRLYTAIRKYGWDTFTKEVLCNATLSVVKQLEQSAISTDSTLHPNGYNMTLGGDGVHGYTHTSELRQYWSEIRLGRKSPEGTGEKIGAALRGRKRSPALGKHLSSLFVGRSYTKETLARMAEGQLRRFSVEENRIALSEAQRRGWTEEKRQKQATNTKGRIWINNGTSAKQLFPKDARAFLEEGWTRGMLPKSQPK